MRIKIPYMSMLSIVFILKFLIILLLQMANSDDINLDNLITRLLEGSLCSYKFLLI